MRNNKRLIAVTTVAMCLSVGLASYKSYQDYKKSSANNLFIQEVEALTDADVSSNDEWYLHNFPCRISAATKAQAKIIAKIFNVKAKVGIEVDLSNFTQYFNHVPDGGTGPCDKGAQVTCNDLWNQILSSTNNN